MLITDSGKLSAWIEAMNFPVSRGAGDEGPHPFITISRQAGAGAHSVAHALLNEFAAEPSHRSFQGWRLCDAETCRRHLEQAHMKVSLESLREEEYRSAIDDFAYQVLANRPPQLDVLEKTFSLIRQQATNGKVIFIGRGAACATRHLPWGIHVRLVAPLQVRAERMAAAWQVSEAAARHRIVEQDTARARLLRHYFNQNIEDSLLYHAVFNTAEMAVPEVARALVSLVESKEHQARQAVRAVLEH